MSTDIAYIYLLIDPRDGRIRYIGKTINPKIRKTQHVTERLNFNHYRSNWIRDLYDNKLRPIMKILEICPIDNFKEREAYYIQLYKSDYLTNSDDSGQGNINRKREIIESSNYKNKKVYQYDIEGNLIHEYNSVREASRKLNISHGNISKCCNGIFKHSSGYIFSYANKKIETIKNPNAIKKRIIELDSSGNVINSWNSIMDCARDTKMDNGNLSRVCNGKLNHIKNRIFKFEKTL